MKNREKQRQLLVNMRCDAKPMLQTLSTVRQQQIDLTRNGMMVHLTTEDEVVDIASLNFKRRRHEPAIAQLVERKTVDVYRL